MQRMTISPRAEDPSKAGPLPGNTMSEGVVPEEVMPDGFLQEVVITVFHESGYCSQMTMPRRGMSDSALLEVGKLAHATERAMRAAGMSGDFVLYDDKTDSFAMQSGTNRQQPMFFCHDDPDIIAKLNCGFDQLDEIRRQQDLPLIDRGLLDDYAKNSDSAG